MYYELCVFSNTYPSMLGTCLLTKKKLYLTLPPLIILLIMGQIFQGTTYQLMKELVILSVNLNYIKNAIQHNERFRSELMYLNVSCGTLDVLSLDLIKRKVSLQNRFKSLVEFQLVEKCNRITDLLIVVPTDQAGFRRKEMEQGWAEMPDIYDRNWLLNIRTGDLLEDNEVNYEFFRKNILLLNSVYSYFQIDSNNPLPSKYIRY